MLALALVDGPDGISRSWATPTSTCRTARAVDDIPRDAAGVTSPGSRARPPDNWPTHVAGHPPGALLFFVAAGPARARRRTSPPGCRRHAHRGRDQRGRCWSPSEPWAPRRWPGGRRRSWCWARRRSGMAVSADAVFAALAAWGTGGAGARRHATRRLAVGWSRRRGAAARRLRDAVLRPAPPRAPGGRGAAPRRARGGRCPVAVAAALAVVLAFAAVRLRAGGRPTRCSATATGTGIAGDRPASYWMWGNLAALLAQRRPSLAAGVAPCSPRGTPGRRPGVPSPRCPRPAPPCVLLADAVPDEQGRGGADLAAVRAVAAAIGGPAAGALAAARARLQVVVALVVQHLLYTTW